MFPQAKCMNKKKAEKIQIKNEDERKKLIAHDNMEHSSPNPYLTSRMVLQDIVGFLH